MLGQELFTALLICPVADLGAVLADEDGIPVMCDITVGDVIGPLEKEGVIRVRDANFSLLSYSFSLVSSNLELWAGSAAMEGPGGVMHAMRRQRHSRRSLPTTYTTAPKCRMYSIRRSSTCIIATRCQARPRLVARRTRRCATS